MMDIGLLGGLRFMLHGSALRVPASGRAQALLAHILLHRDRPLARPYLAGLFWPDSSEKQSRTNLRRVVHELRQGLTDPDRLIDFGGSALQWRSDAPCELDVERFEAALHEGSLPALRAAVGLYGGDLLPGCYDDWIVPRRERLREAFGDALRRLSEMLEGARDYDGAIACTRRLLLHEPLHEESYRRLMRLQALAGDPAGVVRAYRDCATALQTELGVEPSRATRALFDRLRAAATPPRGAGGRQSRRTGAGEPEAGATLGAAVRAREESLFVGRGPELVHFRAWLETGGPGVVLNVHGHGGTGKSALLRMFAELARRLGRSALLVDVGGGPATPTGLLAALAPPHVADPLDHLNATCQLLLLDNCDGSGSWQARLPGEVLSRLDAGIRTVVASRRPVAQVWGHDSPYVREIRPVPLGAFTPEECREYLRRRGLTDPAEQERLAEAAGGNPLAMAMAADLALSGTGPDTATEWRLAVRRIVDVVLREIDEPADPPQPSLRALIDTCAVLRRFDEGTLAAVGRPADAGAAFERLCRLSFVRPADHGLTLQPDVRRLLSDDLRWRDPERYARLRLRAVAHYRRRTRVLPPQERERVAVDCLHATGNERLQALALREGPPGLVHVRPVRAADHTDLRRLWADWTVRRSQPAEDLPGGIDAVLACPAVRLRVACDRDRRVLGFSGTLPVCSETLPLLAASPTTRSLARHRWGRAAALPQRPEESSCCVLRYVVTSDRHREAASAALLGEMLGQLVRGGCFLVTTPAACERELVEALGFRPLFYGRSSTGGSTGPLDIYELDLSRTDFAHWVDGLAGGRPLLARRDRIASEDEVRAVLSHWREDAWLADARMPASEAGPRAVREAIGRAMRRVQRTATGEAAAACRAIEIAYCGAEALTAAEAARRLGVSRATFYRLVKRGVRLLAAAPAATGRAGGRRDAERVAGGGA